MNFERRKIKKRHFHKIILEFDVAGNIDLADSQQIANGLAVSIRGQLYALRHIEATCSKALVQPLPQRTYAMVQLPPREMTVSVVGNKK